MAKWSQLTIDPATTFGVMNAVMPSLLCIQYAGARYHVMSRGDRREAIFDDDADRVEFLRSLSQPCLKSEWQLHAYCLMSNHFIKIKRGPHTGQRLAGSVALTFHRGRA